MGQQYDYYDHLRDSDFIDFKVEWDNFFQNGTICKIGTGRGYIMKYVLVIPSMLFVFSS
jgi:hypothetical protein